MMQCPKCQHERQPAATACPACGVIYDKYDPERAAQLEQMRERLAKTRPTSAPAESKEEAAPTRVAQPLPRGTVAEMPGNTAVCTRCEEVGHVVVQKPGSNAVQVALILLMLVPGIVYYVWRNRETKQVCGACGSDQIVAAKTQVGRKIVETQFPGVAIGRNQVSTRYYTPAPQRVFGGSLSDCCRRGVSGDRINIRKRRNKCGSSSARTVFGRLCGTGLLALFSASCS